MIIYRQILKLINSIAITDINTKEGQLIRFAFFNYMRSKLSSHRFQKKIFNTYVDFTSELAELRLRDIIK